MVDLSNAMHHFHVRRRIHLRFEKYPHPDSFKDFLDKLMYPIGLLGPLMFLPQVVKIYAEKDASSISLISWLLLLIPASLWVLYGLSHRERVIVVCNVAWGLSYILMGLGAILY
ncbi:MAG: hypothetical protein GF334_11350 [Candidatus Altiarchaeales archaeon]|nr:hypothetical protein [Candidatus Altiarchaeales archaeon]